MIYMHIFTSKTMVRTVLAFAFSHFLSLNKSTRNRHLSYI